MERVLCVNGGVSCSLLPAPGVCVMAYYRMLILISIYLFLFDRNVLCDQWWFVCTK